MRGLAYMGKDTVGMVEKPEPKLQKATDALIKITATAPCTTDVHAVENAYYPTTGSIIGHEAVGVVTEVGDMVKYVRPGDRVVIPDINPVLDSDEGMMGVGNWAISPEVSMRARSGLQGALTEMLLYPRADTGLAVIPDGVTDEQAVMLSDMVPTAATGIGYMDIQLGETVAVLGIGPVGLMGVELAALRGAARIIATGSRPVCKDAARQLGATDVLDYHDGPLGQQVLETNGGPVDKVLIAGGNSDMIAEAFSMCRRGGRIACVAAYFEAAPQNAQAISLGSWDKAYRSLYYYCDRLLIKRWLSLIQYGKLHPEVLVSHTFKGVETLPEAFALMTRKDQDMIKPVVLL